MTKPAPSVPAVILTGDPLATAVAVIAELKAQPFCEICGRQHAVNPIAPGLCARCSRELGW